MIRLHTKSNKYRSVNSNEMFVSQLTLQFLSIFLSRRVRCRSSTVLAALYILGYLIHLHSDIQMRKRR